MNNNVSKEDAYKNLEIVNFWINNIDLKASFILAFLGMLLSTILCSDNLEILKTFISVPINTMNFIEILKPIVVLLLISSSLISAVFLILTLLARTKIQNMPKSYYFFGNISNSDRKDFLKYFKKLNDNSIINEILNQVYANSKICDYKSKLYNKSINLMIITIALSFLNYILR